jgi:putative ABC transport system permease protein
VSLEDATAEMAVIAAGLREAHEVNRNVDIRIVSLFDHVVGSRTSRGVWLGFAAVLSLLLIACANVGGLLSARTARRRRELAVRSALGAGRARLVRQLLAEGLSLWAVASVTGIALTYWLIQLLLVNGSQLLPRLDEVALDATALTAAFVGGLGVVLLCSILPALSAATADATATFATRDQSSGQRHGLQRVLVTAQIAGTVTLLVAAVLLAQSFLRAQRQDPGYRADRLLIVRLEFPRDRYPDRPAAAAFFREANERLGRLPGVIAIGGITDFFIRRNAGQWVLAETRMSERQPDARLAIEGVTPGYFRAMGIELIDGRDFDDRDYQPGAPGVYIVSEALARRLWPGESAVGKRVVGATSPPKDGRWNTVVGVVRDLRRESLDVAPVLLGFVPAYPRPMDLTIHTATNPEALIPSVRRELRAIDNALPLSSVFVASQRLSERIGGRRFETQAVGVFAAIALLFSGAGLYAVLAYHVALRTREIGIRSALGAHRSSIVTMVLREGIQMAMVGAVLGVLGAVAAARVLQSLLYETAAIDAASYGAVIVFVMLVAAIAAWLPARRAAGVDPTIALRDG